MKNKKSIYREELLGAIARGWCSEENKHKIMDSDLAMVICKEVESFMFGSEYDYENKNV